MAIHAFGEGGAFGRRAAGVEDWYRVLVESGPEVLYADQSDESSAAVYMSPRSKALLGYSREEWLEDPELWVKILHSEDRERVLAVHDRTRRVSAPFGEEYRLIAKDGSVVWVRDEAASVEDGEDDGRRARVLLDITDRKRREEELRRSEERYRELFENAMEGIARISPEDGVIEQCNPAYAKMLGLAPERATGRSFFEFVNGEDRVEARRQRELRLGGIGSEYEVTVTAADGERRVLLCGGYPLYGPEGAYEGAVQTVTDITDRERREEKLRRSEELFRTTFEAAGVGMAHLSPDGRWLRINDKLCEVSGYGREELLGMSYLDLSLPEDLTPGRERVKRLLAGATGPYSVERRFVRKDGSRVWVNLSVSLARKEPTGEPDYLVCVVEDITARKLRELVSDQLTPLETEVLRRIVAGFKNREIAHDIRYSMGSVKHCVQRVIGKLGVRNRRRAALKAVEIGLVVPQSTRSR